MVKGRFMRAQNNPGGFSVLRGVSGGLEGIKASLREFQESQMV